MRSAASRARRATKCGAGDTIMEMGGSAETAIWLFGEERSRPTTAPRPRSTLASVCAAPSAGHRRTTGADTVSCPGLEQQQPGPEGSVIASHALQKDVEVE